MAMLNQAKLQYTMLCYTILECNILDSILNISA